MLTCVTHPENILFQLLCSFSWFQSVLETDTLGL